MQRLFLAAMLTISGSAALAQEVSVPSVTTASPGAYANPLKLDTDRYQSKNGDGRSASGPAPFGRCAGTPLTQARRNSLEAGYRSRAAASRSSHAGWQWLRDQCGAASAMSLERSAKRRR